MRELPDWPTRDLLRHRAETTPERTALIDVETDRTWSFREFDRHVDHVASALAAVGRGRDASSDRDVSGDRERIGLLMEPGAAFASVCFASLRIGASTVALNASETASELASKLERIDLAAIVCGEGTESLALSIADGPVASVDDPSDERTRSLFATGSTRAPEPVRLDRNTEGLVLFTSGTAGEPKGVRLTVGNLVSSATASAFRLGVLPTDRWLCCLPMYHMGGLAPVVRSTLYGTTAVIQREFGPETTARVIREYGITGVSLVPTMLSRLLDVGWTAPDSLRFVLLGGAPASSHLVDRCEEAGVPVCPTYGMTETASQIATATPEEAFAHEGAVGRPLVCTDVSILDEQGEPVEPGTRGELVVSGPTVTPGYLDASHTEDAFCGRGLRTGDIGYRDDEGRLWVLDRRADRIVTGGENVDPGEVVAALEAHRGIADAAVIGLPDEEWGERVSALVVPAGEEPSLESLLSHCDERLAGFKRPKTIGFAAEIPRTHSGTADRAAVRERLEAEGADVTGLE